MEWPAAHRSNSKYLCTHLRFQIRPSPRCEKIHYGDKYNRIKHKNKDNINKGHFFIYIVWIQDFIPSKWNIWNQEKSNSKMIWNRTKVEGYIWINLFWIIQKYRLRLRLQLYTCFYKNSTCMYRVFHM